MSVENSACDPWTLCPASGGTTAFDQCECDGQKLDVRGSHDLGVPFSPGVVIYSAADASAV
eukprot:1373332-Pyramimonas_sp.AAC.1